MRMGRLLSTVVTSAFTVAAIGCNAIVGTEPVQYRDGVTPESPADASPDASACAPGRHTELLDGDGGAPGDIQGQCGTVVVDGEPCVIDPNYFGLALGMIDTHGWSAYARTDCLSSSYSSYLTIQGVDNAPYPQTTLKGLVGGPSVTFTTGDSFDTSGPNATSTIEIGPLASATERTSGKVKGSATLVSQSGEVHEVTYDLSF